MSVTGERDGQPGASPEKAGVAIADLFAGAQASIAILAALNHMERTGQGQHLDICLLDTQVAMMANMATNYLATGKTPARWGNTHPNIVPYQVFKVADGWVIVACGNDGQFRKLTQVACQSDLADDPRIATAELRMANAGALYAAIEPIIASRTTSFWVEFCERHDIPAGAVVTLHELVDELPLAEHPTAGRYREIPPPVRMSATPPSVRRPAPRLGQHGREVLSEVGLSEAEIDGLVAGGALRKVEPGA